MKMIAKYVKSLDVLSGETDNGEWKRGGMVVRTIGDNERLIALTAFGMEKVLICERFNTDDIIQVEFSPESREFNGRWYTDLRLIRATLLGTAQDVSGKGGEQ